MRVQALTAVLAVELMLLLSIGGCGHRTTAPAKPLTPTVFQPLREELKKPYAELFRIAPQLEYSQAQIAAMRAYLEEAKDFCIGSVGDRAKQYEKELASYQSELQQPATDGTRHNLHCEIQNARAGMNQARVLAQTAIPVAYENREAKLDLIQNWPADLMVIRQQIASGAYRTRRWGDIQDIGFREIASGQEDDIKTGQDAIRDMKSAGLMPKAIEDPAVVNYIRNVAQKVASRSDLHVPLNITVLNSKEINAFALPGGYLFIERGLLEAAENESQLAGVIAHEIAHDAARHGHKLMVRATISSIAFQAAEVAAIMLTGGVASIGIYYAMQYGFYGLGLVLSLNLLGVSREYELQADQLGIQYAWNAGYDPRGFVNFFDKIATKEGYVSGLSWFHSHPPFYQRMVEAEREIMFLPQKQVITNTREFVQMKRALTRVTEAARAEENLPNRPSLLSPEPGCPAPSVISFSQQQQVEDVCQLKPEQLRPQPGKKESSSADSSPD
jgi:Zn-dependent protease with chaperone function